VYYIAADLTVPHTCTGQFQVDFTELCRRLQPPLFYIPQVINRPHWPMSPTNLPVIDEKPGKAGKTGKKDDAKNVPAPEPIEAETPALTESGGFVILLLKLFFTLQLAEAVIIKFNFTLSVC
jgi:cell division septation protein DedD